MDLSDDAIETIIRDFYVDDLLKSVKTVQEGKVLCLELISILQKGGFKLTKFLSNSKELLELLPESLLAHPLSHLNLNEDQLERTLGIKWDIKNDMFVFSAVEAGQHTLKGVFSKPLAAYLTPLASYHRL